MNIDIIKQLLSDYWAQISFVLLGLGYLIKSIISLYNKKKEINMAIFQKGKMDAINHFLDTYSVTRSTINSLPEQDIYDRKISTKEMDDIIRPMLLNLHRANNSIRIYFKSEVFNSFNQIVDNIERINSKLQNIYFDPRSDYSSINKGIDFFEIKTACLEKNEEMLSRVLQEIRRDFE